MGLTFDDGYQDFVTHAMPVLKRYGFTATAFVLAGRLGGHNVWSGPGPDKPLLTADQVREVAQAGIEIGSHGLEHVSLPEFDDTRLRAETVRSRAILQELVGQDDTRDSAIRTGTSMLASWRRSRTAGYDYACAVRQSLGHRPPRHSADLRS